MAKATLPDREPGSAQGNAVCHRPELTRHDASANPTTSPSRAGTSTADQSSEKEPLHASVHSCGPRYSDNSIRAPGLLEVPVTVVGTHVITSRFSSGGRALMSPELQLSSLPSWPSQDGSRNSERLTARQGSRDPPPFPVCLAQGLTTALRTWYMLPAARVTKPRASPLPSTGGRDSPWRHPSRGDPRPRPRLHSSRLRRAQGKAGRAPWSSGTSVAF